MATGSGAFVGIDVSKDRLDVAVLGERQGMQVDNGQKGIKELVARMQELQPELIVVEASGRYQRAVVQALFRAELPVAVVNPARVRQFSAQPVCWPRQKGCMPVCWLSLGKRCSQAVGGEKRS